MEKHPKRPRDANLLAKAVVDLATGKAQDAQDSDEHPMAALGRAGGLKDGRARAERLTPEERRRIAQLAAAARWQKNDR
jgi:hypothetical protein